MVKYGTCGIECKSCSYSAEDHESINSDYGSFRCVLSQSCSHFTYSVRVLTRNTFTPFGKPDEINYQVDVKCRSCGKNYNYYGWAQSFGSYSNSWSRSCCGNRHQVAIDLSSNTVRDILRNIDQIVNIYS